ncbi:DUF5806 family protein [Halobacteria archaeon AArc-m2/3/4]|uniref:DUF5806 family protein n=1 Tax=Natronoglomus mannanivorans TaxID=2979990 RepID=A0AAP2YWZ0_9EURY|nr:DUF5806 family protein [Halobacteria archaeon AArc-xg1-1]MCU4973636.1 DUF5806 family protein [Halobacteria archaeon AArc-m2/3/4]
MPDDASTPPVESRSEAETEREREREPEPEPEHESESNSDSESDTDTDSASTSTETSENTGSSVAAETGDDRTPADERDTDGSNDEADETNANGPMPGVPDPDAVDEEDEVPEDVQKYARFQKMDGAQYDRVNEFLRDRTYVTAREWAIARLCSDFRTETGVEMTKIGENLPELVPFMTDTYSPQAVNQARSSFEDKIRKSGATFLYGAMCDFFTAEELDDVMYEATEVAKFLLEVEGVDLSVEEELEAEERISSVMREVREASQELREEEDLSE